MSPPRAVRLVAIVAALLAACTEAAPGADAGRDAAGDLGADAPALDAPRDAAPDARRGPSDSGFARAHRFLAVDNLRSRLLLVDQIRGDEWERTVPFGSRDLQLVEGDRVLVSHSTGCGEYALRDGAVAWSVSTFRGVETARRLPDGRTLLGANTAEGVVLAYVDRDGRELGRVTLPGLADLRLARPLPNGNVLLTVSGPHRVLEVDPGGRAVWSAPLPGKGYVAERLADGSTLATTGDDLRLVRFDASGALVDSLGGAALADAGVSWLSGLALQDAGTAVIANWLGHGALRTGPHAIELAPDSRLVWAWTDFARADTITNVLVLE
jgi:hypothetical protein